MRPSAALILVLVVLITWCVVVTTASPHGDMMVEKLKKARSREFAKPDPPAGPSGASEQAKGQQPPYTAPEAATVDAAPPSGSGNKDEVEAQRSLPDPIAVAPPPHSDAPATPAVEAAAAHIHATGETDAESRAHESVAHDDTPKVEIPAQEVLHQPPQVDATAPTTAAPEVHEDVPATAEAPAAEAPVADANTAAPPATAVDVQSEEKAEPQQQQQEAKHDDTTDSGESSKVAEASAQPRNQNEQRPPEALESQEAAAASADTSAEAQPPVDGEGQRAPGAEQVAQAEVAAASPDTAADATAAEAPGVEETQQPPTDQGAAPATVAEEAAPTAAVVLEEPHHDATPPSVETVPEQPPQYHHEDAAEAAAHDAAGENSGATPAMPLPHRGGGVAQPPRHEVDAPTVDAAVVSGETPTVADHPSDSAEQAEPEPQQQQQQPEAQVVEQEAPDRAQAAEPAQAENEHQPHIGVPDQQSPPAQEEQAPAAPTPSEVAPPAAVAAPSSVTPQQHSRSRRNVNLSNKGKPDQQRTERRNPLMHKDASQDDKNRFGQNLRLNKAKGRATHLTASARSLLEVVNQATTGVGALPPHEPRDPLPSDPQIAEMGLVELEHYLHRLETTLSHLNTYCHEAAQSLNTVRDEKEREDAERQARLEQEAHERAERERTENEERERQAERERVERQLEIDRLKALSDHERNNREAATRARYRAEAELAAKNGPTAETGSSNDDAAASKRGLSTSQMLLYGGIGLGVALAIGLGLFLVARGRGKRKVQNAATKAAKDGGGNGGLAFVGTPVASPVAPVPTFHPQPHHQAPLAGTGDGMSLRNRALARFKVEDV